MPRPTTKSFPRGTRNDIYRSTLEKNIAEDLGKQGVKFEFEKQSYPYTLTKRYTPDFFLSNKVIVEAKGWFRGPDRTKLLAIKKEHPELDIRIVFQRASSIICKSSKKPTTYSQWATKNGFLWAEKTIPKEWTHNEPKNY